MATKKKKKTILGHIKEVIAELRKEAIQPGVMIACTGGRNLHVMNNENRDLCYQAGDYAVLEADFGVRELQWLETDAVTILKKVEALTSEAV